MTELVAEYRAGLRRGVLLIQRCAACRHAQMYPRYRCTACQSDDLRYEASTGRGILLTHTVVRAVPPRGFEDDLPYALGVVRLDEGVQLLGRLAPSASGEWNWVAGDLPVRFEPAPAEEIDRRPVAWFGRASSPGIDSGPRG